MEVKPESFYDDTPDVNQYLDDILSERGLSEEIETFSGPEAYRAFVFMVDGYSADIDYIERPRKLSVDDFLEFFDIEHGDDELYGMALTQNNTENEIAYEKNPESIEAEKIKFDEIGLLFCNNPEAIPNSGVPELTHFQFMIDSDDEHLLAHHMDVGDPSFQENFFGRRLF